MADVLMLSVHAPLLDRRIALEAGTLVEAGHRVVLATTPVDIAGAGLDPRVQVRGAGQAHPSRRGADDLGRLRRWALAAAAYLPPTLFGPLQWLYHRRGGDRFQTAYFASLLNEGERFDVIHAHDLPTLPAGLELAQRQHNAGRGRPKVVLDAHELYPYTFPDRFRQRRWLTVQRRHLPEADAVIAVNDRLADELARRHAVALPTVIHNGCKPAADVNPADDRRWAEVFGQAPAPGERVVLYQGAFGERRNLPMLVAAFDRLPPTVRLYMLGFGPLADELRHQAGPSVRVGGPVPPEQLPAFTRRAELGVIPYPGGLLNHQLCTPNKLYELLAAGVPMIACDELQAVAKIITDARIGTALPMADPHQIANAVTAGLDQIDSGAFELNAFEAAQQRYGWPTQAKALLDLYGSLL
jgi:glycosyltransferase involved in cell wall biosynthesis